MAKKKKYYWLKLKEDFFKDKEIKKLRRIAGGDTYTIIYLKMLLLGLRDTGRLYFEGIEDTFAEEIALELDEDTENVKVTLLYMVKMGLLEEVNEREMLLTRLPECVGSETRQAEIMRRKRARTLLNGNNVTGELPEVTKSYTEIEIEKREKKEDRERDKGSKPPRPPKHKYGEYKNVLLTDEELTKLKAEYPDYLDKIERLSSYVASTGKSYKSHYATIRNWARKDAEKGNGSYADNRKRAEQTAEAKWGRIGTHL